MKLSSPFLYFQSLYESEAMKLLTIGMSIVAVICIIVGLYLHKKKQHYGKIVSITGLLLLVNPILYFISHSI